MCYFWTAKVAEVGDGDTIEVYLKGDSSHHKYFVRFTGINAMEMHVYSHHPSRWRGECMAIPATRYVYDMVRKAHGVVRLAAQRPSSHSGNRLRRQVSVRVGGHWVDLNAHEASAGLALWLINGSEWAWNKKYGELSAQAAAHHRGLFNTQNCGSGPSQNANLSVLVKYDADGNDGKNVNGEWARIINDSAFPVPIGHWWFRESSYLGHYAHGYTFPAGTTIPANGEITLHVGRGRNTARTFYWGMNRPLFGNGAKAPHWEGDGGYLFDPQGDLRAWMMYPCFLNCGTPLSGEVRLSATEHKPFVARLTNTSASPVRLEGYLLEVPYVQYAFGHGTVIPPGQTLRVHVGGDPSKDTPLDKYWGRGGPNGFYHGFVGVQTYQDTIALCDHWAARHC